VGAESGSQWLGPGHTVVTILVMARHMSKFHKRYAYLESYSSGAASAPVTGSDRKLTA
jgi:hypothetical protein